MTTLYVMSAEIKLQYCSTVFIIVGVYDSKDLATEELNNILNTEYNKRDQRYFCIKEITLNQTILE